MTAALLGILIALCVALLIEGFLERGAVYDYPFLSAAVMIGWVIPQLMGLTNDRYLPPGALDKTLVVITLCTIMIKVGFVWPVRPAVILDGSFDPQRLAAASLLMSLFGAFFFYKISALPAEITRATSWSGAVVAYDFFSRVLSYGFVLALIVYTLHSSRLALLVILFDGLFYFHRIVIAGRRWSFIEFTLAVGFILWLNRRIIPPRIAIVAGLVFATLMINAIGHYRGLTLDPAGPRWDKVLEIDLLGNFKTIVEEGSYELRNTVFAIEAADRRGKFDFGAFNWNMLVFNFVPAQLVGSSLKSALFIDTGDLAYDTEFRYRPHTGTTLTGFADAFSSFWYFGWIKFFLIAVIMRAFHLGARNGSIAAQMFYVLLLGHALLSITHHSQWFFSGLVHIAIFVLPALWLCRVPPAHEAAATAADPAPSSWQRTG